MKSVPFLKLIQHYLAGLGELLGGIDARCLSQQLQSGVVKQARGSLAQIGCRICPLFNQMQVFHCLQPVYSKHRLHQLIDICG